MSMQSALEPMVPELVKALSAALASNNSAIRDAAIDGIDTMLRELEPSVLVQPFVQTAQFGLSLRVFIDELTLHSNRYLNYMCYLL